MAVRFYIDADLLGLAKILVGVRSDVTYPGDPGGIGVGGVARDPCPVPAQAKDVDWASRLPDGWVVITRDRHIQHRPAEKAAVLTSMGRHVTLDARKQLDRWGQLEIFVTQWRALEQLAAELPGPWVYSASRSGLRKVL